MQLTELVGGEEKYTKHKLFKCQQDFPLNFLVILPHIL